MPLLFLDTETSGLDPKRHRIVQLHAEFPKLKESITLEIAVTADGEVDPVALEVNQLTEEDVRNNPKRINETAAVDLLQAFIKKHNKGARAQVVAHNAEFDKAHVMAMFERTNADFKTSFHYAWEDTCALFLPLRNLRLISPSSLKLRDLCFYFGLPAPTHAADADVKATIALYRIYYDIVQSADKKLFEPRIKTATA